MGYAPSSQAYPPEYGQQMASGYGPGEPIYQKIMSALVVDSEVTPTYTAAGTYGPATEYYPQTLHSQRYDPSSMYMEGNATPNSYPSDGCKGSMSRNIIGSVVGSAAFLTEPEPNQREGIWFVLQDLSVRLEGDYW